MASLNIKLNHEHDGSWFAVNKLDNEKFLVEVQNPESELAGTVLDRGQAHLLMLYLQEHLGYRKDNLLGKYKGKGGSYYCVKCDSHHVSDYDCTIKEASND